MMNKWVSVLLFLFQLDGIVLAKQCDLTDFVYEYTECDQNGERWRIALPKSHSVQCENIPPPQTGVNCSFSCTAGHFLNLKDQTCEKCPPGKYSLGSGQRYERLIKWPPGFSVENYPDPTEQLIDKSSQHCPLGVGWIIEEGEIRYKPTSCISKLSISLQLVQNGYVEFTYKMPRNSRGLVSNIDVRNEQCQSYGNQFASLLRSSEEEAMPNAEWIIKKLDLRRGQNLVTWTVANNIELTTLADVVYISKLDIIGLPYTSSCSICPEGTYADDSGHAFCKACPANYFSNSGASKCDACAEYQYSFPRSNSCKQKPSCEASDFYPVFETCTNQKQAKHYEKIFPVICQESDPHSSIMPKSLDKSPCLKCSPGTQRDSTGKCTFCPNGHRSPGDVCTKCPPMTRPNYGYFITNWEKLPEFADTGCEYVTIDEAKDCNIKPSWIPMGDRIETATSRETGVAMELSINVTSGFYNFLFDEKTKPSMDNPLATLSIELETKCFDESCSMYIVQEITNQQQQKSFRFLNVLNGTLARQKMDYSIYHNGNTRFIVAYMRSGTTTRTDYQTDKAIIYSFNITNVGRADEKLALGGADKCIPCPTVDAFGNCQKCSTGHYIDIIHNKCVHCPEGTKLNRTSTQIGPESCIKCGPNMESEDGVDCSFTGKITVPNLEPNEKPLKFDLSPLKGQPLIAEGIKVFAREGNSYFHSFNISIFSPVECRDYANAQPVTLKSYENRQNSDNEALFCRSTAVPVNEINQTMASKTVYVSPLVVGHKIASITRDRKFRGFYLSDKDLEYDTMADKSRPIDIHFYFEPIPSHFHKCVNGSIGVLTARCEPTATNEAQIRLPRGCPDGTCDGCVFHVIVETSHACPICDAEDFQQIRGECVNGKQQVHWIPSKHCILSGAQTKEKTENCTGSGGLKLLLLLAGVLIALLILANVVFYQRNKSLEYRYMRIVEGKEPEDMETCGLESDDDDDLEDEDSGTRVYFGKKKDYFVAGIKKTGANSVSAINTPGTSNGLNGDEQDKFISLSLDDN